MPELPEKHLYHKVSFLAQDKLSFSPTVMWAGLYKVTRPLNDKQTVYNIMTLSLSALRGTRSAPGFRGVTRLWSLGQ